MADILMGNLVEYAGNTESGAAALRIACYTGFPEEKA